MLIVIVLVILLNLLAEYKFHQFFPLKRKIIKIKKFAKTVNELYKKAGYHDDVVYFRFAFVNNILAGMAKRKESLIQTFYETSAAQFFD